MANAKANGDMQTAECVPVRNIYVPVSAYQGFMFDFMSIAYEISLL